MTTVSIIIPCYNEQNTILDLLAAIRNQTYPMPSMQILIADAMSIDETRSRIERFAESHNSIDLKILDNYEGTIPAGLNIAIAESQGEVVIRLDAHSAPAPDYIERCLATLEATDAANVGGVWEIKSSTASNMARSIAAAASHPLGAGDARYRLGGAAGEIDTVPFGAYPRKWLDRVGRFNEMLLTNEDYEYNLRLRQAGGVVWFDPSIRSTYFARPDLISLLKQYGRYGFWKAQMLKLHPESIRWRQVVAPLLVLTVLSLLLIGLFQPLAWILLAGILLTYGALILTAGIAEGIRKQDAALAFGVPLAFAAMHLSWGGAFLLGIVRSKAGGHRLNGKD